MNPRLISSCKEEAVRCNIYKISYRCRWPISGQVSSLAISFVQDSSGGQQRRHCYKLVAEGHTKCVVRCMYS